MRGWTIPKNTLFNEPQYLAQVGHFLGGAALMFLACVFAGFAPTWWVAWICIALAAAVKEYWYDANYELPKQTFSDNTMDFAFYQLGAGVGVLVSWFAHHLHRIT